MGVRSSVLSGYQPRRLSEKGNGKDRAKSIPKPIRELLMEVVPRGGPLIEDSFLAGLKTGGGGLHKPARSFLLSSGRACLSLFLRRVILD